MVSFIIADPELAVSEYSLDGRCDWICESDDSDDNRVLDTLRVIEQILIVREDLNLFGTGWVDYLVFARIDGVRIMPPKWSHD